MHDTATLTVDDYRGVYRRFKANPLLQELHARYPVVAMWDDGEFVNGIYRTLEPARAAAAKQAWFEFQPVVRRGGDPDRTYREITWGDLASFLLLDVRQYRDPTIASVPGGPLGLSTVDSRTEVGAHMFDADRTCLGPRQKSWLKRRLLADDAVWRPTSAHIDYIDLVSQGYGLVELTPRAATVTFRVIDTFDRQARATTRASWVVPVDPHRRRPLAAPRPAGRPLQAPRPGAQRVV